MITLEGETIYIYTVYNLQKKTTVNLAKGFKALFSQMTSIQTTRLQQLLVISPVHLGDLQANHLSHEIG